MYQTKIRTYVFSSRFAAFVGLLLLIALSRVGPLAAQALSQGYGFDQPLQRGMIVRLKDGDATKVAPVSQDAMDKTHGIIVDPNDAPVRLSGDGNKVFVATGGHYDVLVTNQNGTIAAGDYITVSAIDGVGMKAGDREPIVVGRALAAYDGKTGALSSTDIKDSTGTSHSVTIGRVSVDVDLAKNPLLRATEPNLPEFLRRASEAIAGKPVNTVRVYIAVVVFIVSTVVAGVLLYGGIRSAIISIGRNPLSKKSIIRSMIQVIIVGITIFLTGIFGVYLLLKL